MSFPINHLKMTFFCCLFLAVPRVALSDFASEDIYVLKDENSLFQIVSCQVSSEQSCVGAEMEGEYFQNFSFAKEFAKEKREALSLMAVEAQASVMGASVLVVGSLPSIWGLQKVRGRHIPKMTNKVVLFFVAGTVVVGYLIDKALAQNTGIFLSRRNPSFDASWASVRSASVHSASVHSNNEMEEAVGEGGGGSPKPVSPMVLQEFEAFSEKDWKGMDADGEQFMKDFAPYDAEMNDVEAWDEEVYANAAKHAEDHEIMNELAASDRWLVSLETVEKAAAAAPKANNHWSEALYILKKKGQVFAVSLVQKKMKDRKVMKVERDFSALDSLSEQALDEHLVETLNAAVDMRARAVDPQKAVALEVDERLAELEVDKRLAEAEYLFRKKGSHNAANRILIARSGPVPNKDFSHLDALSLDERNARLEQLLVEASKLMISNKKNHDRAFWIEAELWLPALLDMP